MKKALMILMLMAIAFAGYAQDGNLKKQTYFRIGLSTPSWKYLGSDGKSDWYDAKRIGGVLEVGNIFMLNSLKIAPDMRMGINVDFLSLNYHRFSESESDFNMNFFYFGSKIGPSFSYSPVSKLVFDVYAKINPVWVAGSVWAYRDDAIEEDEFFLGFMGIKWSVGLNVRYSLLMLGFEFNPGYAKFKKYDTENNEFSDIYMENSVDNSKRIPVPAMNFTIGISL